MGCWASPNDQRTLVLIVETEWDQIQRAWAWILNLPLFHWVSWAFLISKIRIITGLSPPVTRGWDEVICVEHFALHLAQSNCWVCRVWGNGRWTRCLWSHFRFSLPHLSLRPLTPTHIAPNSGPQASSFSDFAVMHPLVFLHVWPRNADKASSLRASVPTGGDESQWISASLLSPRQVSQHGLPMPPAPRAVRVAQAPRCPQQWSEPMRLLLLAFSSLFRSPVPGSHLLSGFCSWQTRLTSEYLWASHFHG